MLAGLRAAGAEVVECRMEMPFTGHGKRAVASRPLAWPGAFARWAHARRRFRRLVAAAIEEHRPDALFVPYPAHPIVPEVRRVFAGPLIADLFLSAHETLVEDRRRFRPGSLAARALRRLDRRACAAADLVLLDTPQHAAHVARLCDLAEARFGWVPIADPRAPDGATPYAPPRAGEPLEVLFFGTGVPLHGLEHLLAAVARAPHVRLTLIGGSAADRARARALPQGCVRIGAEFVADAELRAELRRAHLVAGIFSAGAKAARVVPFKVVHALAEGRPVLTADTPAVRALLQPGRDCMVCAPGDPSALACALTLAHGDAARLADIARCGRAAYEHGFSIASVGARLALELARAGVRLSAPEEARHGEPPALAVSAAPEARG
jgi:glycosyltransferase involved in cell wall biosynthesis